LNLEIFGFLHLSDLSNPPVASRHQVRVASDAEDKTFLSLLLTAMQNTKTVAMCSLFIHEATGSHKPSGPSPRLWHHGFVHHYDQKLSVLLLSVFHENCTGLPWIGQFQHLAPVTDFAGTQLYDDRDGSSPFPVRVPDRLSYVPETAAPACPGGAGTVPPAEPFRYVSWVSPTTLTVDVNKLLRLGRRLPDKAALFFKEFTRLRTAALAYGCPDLLNEVVELTKASYPAFADGTASETLTTHLKTMSRMLAEPDFRPS
uniref:IntS14_C domain-containing protein n=1 Tax=Echinostoma caproni TaxID=27848 RepID=A0A183ASW3_9TREM